MIGAKGLALAEPIPPPPGGAGVDVHARIGHYMKRLAFLRMERSTWVPSWMEMAQNLLPFHWRYLQAERNKGWKRHQNIVNSTPLLAVRTLASGMMSGLTSKARRWFKLTTGDLALDESGAVHKWCSDVEDICFAVLARSNVYRVLANMYAEMGVFGTTAAELNEDPHDIIRAYALPLGQYSLANSARLSIDTCLREYSMSARQLVQEFGEESVSPFVKNALQNQNRDVWVQVLRVTEPNSDYTAGRDGPSGMKWRSCYLELGGTAGDAGAAQVVPSGVPDRFLRESGFREFPIIAARWNTLGEDVYGFGPGWDVIGDAKMLQEMERQKLRLLAKIVNPPMVAPSAMRTKRIGMQPGDVVYADAVGAQPPVRPAIELPANALPAIEAGVREVEQRIKSLLYSDLWQMFQQWEQGQPITATEVNARQEEKMLLLGPAIESVEGELLDPLLHRLLSILDRRGMLPPPPQELMGRAILPEYTSIMAQAAKLVGIGNIERYLGFVKSAAEIQALPSAPILDTIDFDKMGRDYADRVGVKPELSKDDEEVQKIRDERAKQQQAAQQGAAMAQAAKSAKDLGTAGPSGENTLSSLLGNLGPEASAQAGGGPTIQ